jgi:hypothetical protein
VILMADGATINGKAQLGRSIDTVGVVDRPSTVPERRSRTRSQANFRPRLTYADGVVRLIGIIAQD